MLSKNLNNTAPVITIDGPSGAGKGTIAKLLAQSLSWHFLDSGALYRVLAVSILANNIDSDDIKQITVLAHNLPARFITDPHNNASAKVFLKDQDVTKNIRLEEVGNLASKIAKFPQVRDALVILQRSFRKMPGLVADGRDMGTVIFPDAKLKIFLTASLAERANRRFKQLNSQGIDVKIAAISEELAKRDYQDSNRTIAPLKPAFDAVVIDTTHLSISEVIQKILKILKGSNFAL